MEKMNDIKPFEKKVQLSSPTIHEEELQFIKEAIESNWVSTVGENIDSLESMMAGYTGMKYAVGLSSGTSALHMCVKLAAERIYTDTEPGRSLKGRKVFCSDMTFDASVNPVVYEDGEPVFIDTDRETWNTDPEALEAAFKKYPDVKIVVLAHLYGVPAKMDEIVDICTRHNALIVEDAAEALGARYDGDIVRGMCGSFGDFNAVSFNGNKIITGSTGGMFLTNDENDAKKVRKWSTQSRDPAPWYQHTELGYNYRMSNIIAGVARGNMLHIDEHLSQKKAIYERYKEGFKDLPVMVNPFESKSTPNYWLTSMLIDKEAMCEQKRGDLKAEYVSATGKTCPTEVLETLTALNTEGRPIWKPMHMQPIYKDHAFVSLGEDIGADIFNRGLCLPSDNKMTQGEQEIIIQTVRRLFE
ncbi:MAG: DegT/DnrJ/EryC1/StrS family aminotransferase [Lachnospiraceae bacterium]|nr:DegT/DnrJ/EryC1/StrS family aminotransferase [Lachnospiraceae bacterium]